MSTQQILGVDDQADGRQHERRQVAKGCEVPRFTEGAGPGDIRNMTVLVVSRPTMSHRAKAAHRAARSFT
jgi:hypothetical protein